MFGSKGPSMNTSSLVQVTRGEEGGRDMYICLQVQNIWNVFRDSPLFDVHFFVCMMRLFSDLFCLASAKH
jgi:hypothetical protein